MTYFADCFHTLFQREIHTGQIAILDSEEPMDQLLRRFSFLGSKIDWSQTLGHVSATSLVLNGDASVERAGFLRQYLPDNSPSAPVFYLNDNALSFTSRWQHNTLLTLGETLLANIPQHHYFFDEQASWCLCLCSEGYMDFGRSQASGAPTNALEHAER